MKSLNLIAAAALAIGMAAVPAMAAQDNKSPVGEGAVLSPNLGIDMGRAGTTDETRMAFWNGMTAEQQQQISQRCADEALQTSFTSDETAFCGVTVRR